MSRRVPTRPLSPDLPGLFLPGIPRGRPSRRPELAAARNKSGEEGGPFDGSPPEGPQTCHSLLHVIRRTFISLHSAGRSLRSLGYAQGREEAAGRIDRIPKDAPQPAARGPLRSPEPSGGRSK